MNIVILTIGRSGSTIMAKMLEALGWNLPGADSYAEHVEFRRLNDKLIRGIQPDPQAIRDLIVSLRPHQPWVLKDPRLVCTWEQWERYLDRAGNLLIWLTRDLAAIEQSLRRAGWGEDTSDGFGLRRMSLPAAARECARHYAVWRGPKARIGYEQMHRAVELFDPARGRTLETTGG